MSLKGIFLGGVGDGGRVEILMQIVKAGWEGRRDGVCGGVWFWRFLEQCFYCLLDFVNLIYIYKFLDIQIEFKYLACVIKFIDTIDKIWMEIWGQQFPI